MARPKDMRKGKSATPAVAGAASVHPGLSSSEIAELERNERRDGWLLAIFALAALGAAALAFVFFSGEIDQNDRYVRADGSQEAIIDMPFTWGSAESVATEPEPAETEETAAPAPAATRRPARRPAAAAPNPLPASANTTVLTPLPTPTAPPYAGPARDDVGRETQRALRTGKAQLWNENGDRGYVLVSAAVAYGKRICRQVSYSHFVEGAQETSAATQWCRESRLGRWREDARGPE